MPSRVMRISQATGSNSASDRGESPSTKAPLEALSAMVSVMEMSQSRIRLPTTSMAGNA
jgi:hypothetical protein